jgi:hypothetical protein
MINTSKKLQYLNVDKIYTNINEWKQYKNEGLIHTYPKGDAQIEISRVLFLNLNDFTLYKIKSNDEHQNKIDILLYTYLDTKNKIKQNTLKSINIKVNLCGWFISKINLYDKNNNLLLNKKVIKYDEFLNNFDNYLKTDNLNTIQIILESLFDIKIKKQYDKLYHITNKDNVEKIKRSGLYPTHNDRSSIHPDRIYLGFNKDELLILVPQFQENDIEIYDNYLDTFRENGFKVRYIPSFDYVLLEINVSKMLDDDLETSDTSYKYEFTNKELNKFIIYQDINYKNGCYTLSGIASKYITILEHIKYTGEIPKA